MHRRPRTYLHPDEPATAAATYDLHIVGDWYDRAADNYVEMVTRFTNCFRASDRVSQFLIRNVAYRGSQQPEELVSTPPGSMQRDVNAETGDLLGQRLRAALQRFEADARVLKCAEPEEDTWKMCPVRSTARMYAERRPPCPGGDRTAAAD